MKKRQEDSTFPGLTLINRRPVYENLSVALKRLEDLPTLPDVAMRVLQVVRDPRSSTKDVEAVIVRDPVLSAKILRAANSAFYGFSHKVTTVGHAVALLGFNQVLSLLLSVTMFDRYRTRRLDLHGFWQHVTATACGAQFLARHGQVPPDEAFMSGLVHDIGKLAFAFLWEGVYMDVLRLQYHESLSSRDAERQLLGFDHTLAGSAMVEKWLLPDVYVHTVRSHHEPLQAEAGHQVLCGLVCLANFAAHEALPTRFAHAWDTAELEQARKVVNLPEDVTEQCIVHIKEAEEEIEVFLSAIQ